MKRITKVQLAIHLNRHLGAEVGLTGLGILIYGWFRYRRYGKKYRKAVYNRDWLYITEVQDLSEYAGYDLSVCREPSTANDANDANDEMVEW